MNELTTQQEPEALAVINDIMQQAGQTANEGTATRILCARDDKRSALRFDRQSLKWFLQKITEAVRKIEDFLKPYLKI